MHLLRTKTIGLYAATLSCITLAACGDSDAQRVAGGDAANGKAVIEAIACGACHRIPGVAGANGVVGPSLDGFGKRQFIAGEAPNNASNLAQWVKAAPSIAPDTAMPALPISDSDARDVAEFLFRLR